MSVDADSRSDVATIKRRLKSLDEFQSPEFVGRMARVQRRQKLVWNATLLGAVAIGAAIGLLLL